MIKTAAIFVDHPRCSIAGVNCITDTLRSQFKFKIFTRHQVLDNFFDDVDLIIIPGGFGDADSFKHSMKHHKKRIREYVKNGGRYLGICMGAYWAGSHYLKILKDVDCVQYIKRPGADTRRPHAKNIEVTWNGRKQRMFWYDGCSIIGTGIGSSKFDPIATYSNGDVMAGYQGRIGLIGTHPEAEKDWYDQYSWMKKIWSEDNINKQLLLEFTEQLINR